MSKSSISGVRKVFQTLHNRRETGLYADENVAIKEVRGRQLSLRAPDQKYRESDDRSEISYFILFHQKYPFGKLFSKIIINSPSAFWFFQKLEKFKIRLEAPLRPPETRENCAFLASSYATMEIVSVLPLGS